MSYINKASNAFAVTPNDGADLPNGIALGVRVGVAGNVKMDIKGGSQGIVIPCTTNNDFYIPISRIYATGTTATGIVALY